MEITPNIEHVCRACMCKEQNLFSIIECCDSSLPLRIYEILNSIAPQLVVQPSIDGLPVWICTVCRNKLTIAYHFQQMCIKTDKRLRALMGDIESSESDTTEKLTELAQQDPLMECDSMQLQSCIRMEVSEDEDEEMIFSTLLKAAEPLVAINDFKEKQEFVLGEKKNQPVKEHPSHIGTYDVKNSESALSEQEEDWKSPTKPTQRKREVPKLVSTPPRTSKIHNEAVIEEIEKPSVRSKTKFSCPDCGKDFDRPYNLRRHMSVHSTERPFQCDICEYRFSSRVLLVGHQNKHRANAELINHKGLKPFVCTICEKSYKLNAYLKQHMLKHTNEMPFLCAQCGKFFNNNSNLRQHLLRHSKERRYCCPECPSRFFCQSDQIKHMSIHRDYKPHICDVCGSGFARSYTLKKHKNIHTGERPYKCDECQMTFIFLGSLRRHQRKHTGEKPYKCKFCERAYSESGDLTKHLRTHVGEKTYMCQQCPAAFKYQTELRKHQSQHYKQEKELSALTTTTTTTTATSTSTTSMNQVHTQAQVEPGAEGVPTANHNSSTNDFDSSE